MSGSSHIVIGTIWICTAAAIFFSVRGKLRRRREERQHRLAQAVNRAQGGAREGH